MTPDSKLPDSRYNMYIPEIQCTIDDFKSHAQYCLLTHFHSDHLRGLKKGRQRSKIVCSPQTAALMTEVNRTPPEDLIVVEPGKSVSLANNARVTAIDANHCPGALMFLVDTGRRRILHTGDFKLNDRIRSLAGDLGVIDLLCVDCTYNEPRYRFPPQSECIDRILAEVGRHPNKEVFIGIYSLGKDKILDALFRVFKQPIYMSRDELRLYKAIKLDYLATVDRDSTRFRAHAMGYFGRYFKADAATKLVIIPTGWAVDRQNDREGFVYVPYSDHCDYDELCEFIRLVKARDVIPTSCAQSRPV